MATWLENLVGTSLLGKDGEKATSELAGKSVIALYFSAHWCGPCRRFTPKLSEFYSKFKDSKDFEVIFVTADRSESEFTSYYGEHPWLAVKYSDSDRTGFDGTLAKKYKVRGIPSLVLLDGATGEKITTEGVQEVYGDSSGEGFPYRPKPISELLPTKAVNKDGAIVEIPGDKYKLFYFSAHWCPPCRRFTPKLIEWYNKRKADGNDDVEIIFVSSDRDQGGFDEYYGSMPWLAVPFAERNSVGQPFSRALGIEGIPSLVLFSAENEIVNTECVGAVQAGKSFPFLPPNVVDLSEGISVWGHDVNSVPAMIAFLENADDDDQTAVEEKLEELASAVKANMAGDDEPEIIFLTSKENDEMSGRIKGLCNLDLGDSIALLILNLPDNGGYYVKKLEDSEDPVEAVEAYQAAFRSNPGSLTRQQLSR